MIYLVSDTIPQGLPNFILDFNQDDTGYYMLVPLDMKNPQPRFLQTLELEFTATLTIGKK
jgi:hypothetical protein